MIGVFYKILSLVAALLLPMLLLPALLFVGAGLAQQEAADAEERSWVLAFIESQLSTPNRQIRLHDIDGTFSSQASIGEITIADRDGVWLRITRAKIDWNRAALLTGHISINELSAERIEILRRPLSPPSRLPDMQAQIFTLPQLPVGLEIGSLSSPLLVLGEDLFGRATRLALGGSLTLADGNLTSSFGVQDIDGVGRLDLTANYDRSENRLKLDFDLSEPEGGIIAHLLRRDDHRSVNMTIKGEGVLDNLDIDLAFDLGGERLVDGQMRLRQREEGQLFQLEATADLGDIVPLAYQPLFGQPLLGADERGGAQNSKARLELSGLLLGIGGWQIDDFRLHAGENFQLVAQIGMGGDGFLRRLNLDVQIAPENNDVLPWQLEEAQLKIAYGMKDAQEWHGGLTVNGLAWGDMEPINVKLDMGGQAENLDDASRRRVSAFIYGGASRASWDRQDNIDEVTMLIDMALPARDPLSLNNFYLAGEGFSLALAGEFSDWQFDGQASLLAADLAGLARFFAQDFGGKAEMQAKGQIGIVSGAFDLEIDGLLERIRSGNKLVELVSESGLAVGAHVKRDAEGLHFNKFAVKGELVEMQLSGIMAKSQTDLDLAVDIADLFLLDERLHGGVALRAAARGHNGFISLAAQGNMDAGTVAGRRLEQTQLDFNGFIDTTRLYYQHFGGQLTGTGRFEGEPVGVNADIIWRDDDRLIDNLSLTLGANQIAGQSAGQIAGRFDIGEGGVLAGKLQLDVADLSALAALTHFEGSGRVGGEIHFSNEEGTQRLDILAKVEEIEFAGHPITLLDISAHLRPFEEAITYLEMQAQMPDHLGRLDVRARLARAPQQSWNLMLDEAQFQAGLQGGLQGGGGLPKAILAQPAQLSLSETGKITIGETRLEIEGGQVIVAGQIDADLAIDVRLEQLPLALVNLFQPRLGAQGAVDGIVYIKGSRTAPQIEFSLAASEASAGVLQQYGIAGLNVHSEGRVDGDGVLVRGFDVSGGGIEAHASGRIALANQELDLDVALEHVALAAFADIIKAPGLAGTLTGSGHIGGTLANPQGQFDLGAAQISSTLLIENGLAPLAIRSKGSFDNQILLLDNFTAEGPADLHFQADGVLPLSGAAIDVRGQGRVPLALGNRFLQPRGGQLQGLLTVDMRLSGSLQNPLLGGDFTIIEGQFVDPQTNIRLNNIRIEGALVGNSINLTTISATSAHGGNLGGSGTISTDWQQGLPANLRLQLGNLRYNDGVWLVATMAGEVGITGPLLRDFELAGQIDVERMEMSIPNFTTSAQEIEVMHKNLDEAAAVTLARAQINRGEASRLPQLQQRSLTPRLDLEIRAPARIFVRGRGLDSELGGSMRLRGTVAEPQPTGSFDLIRGRFDILTKRLELEEGRITLTGTLTPALDFVARTSGGGFDVVVRLAGVGSDLSLNFTSQPELPQDEVLAFLIFNRSVAELSPLQIARLAASVAELVGQNGPSLMGRLRTVTGLDDLDVTTDGEGATGVRAGRYLRDNIYLGVEADNQGQTRGSINLDISPDLKAKGSVGSDSNSSIGLFFEKDY